MLPLLLLATGAGARSASETFCKCSCDDFTKIIQLASSQTCDDCHRQFCVDNGLCMNVAFDKISTLCFHRDSLKEEAIIVLFLLVVFGLMGYSFLKPRISVVR